MTETIETSLTALEEQVGCYRQLASLAEQQHEHVRQSQTEALLVVLQQRQEVVDRMISLEPEAAPLKREWERIRNELAPELRSKAESLLGEARELLERITSADQADTMVLQQRKMNLSEQIKQASSAKQVNKKYGAAAYGSRSKGSLDVQQ